MIRRDVDSEESKKFKLISKKSETVVRKLLEHLVIDLNDF